MFEIIAIISMIVDHIGTVFFPDITILRIIGRLAFPIYAYLICVGINKTHDVNQYFLRLFLLAIISQPIFYFLFDYTHLNICFILALGLFLLAIINSKKVDAYYKLLLVTAGLYFTFLIPMSYGPYGLITILLFNLKNKNYMLISQIIWNLVSLYLFTMPLYQLYALVGVLIVYFLYDKPNKKILPRKVNYLVYPVHLLILLIIKLMLS